MAYHPINHWLFTLNYVCVSCLYFSSFFLHIGWGGGGGGGGGAYCALSVACELRNAGLHPSHDHTPLPVPSPFPVSYVMQAFIRHASGALSASCESL